MEQKFDYPVVGSIEVTARDLAFINILFKISTELGKHPYMMVENIQMMMDMAMLVTIGPGCATFIDDLHAMHTKNGKDCGQAYRDVSMKAAETTISIMAAAFTTAHDQNAKSELDYMVEQLFKKDYEPEPPSTPSQPNAGGYQNAPETGYQ